MFYKQKKEGSLLNDVLNDQEKALLQGFADNEALMEAVRKVLLGGVYFNGTLKKEGLSCDPLTNWAMVEAKGQVRYTNEQLGERIRGIAEGLSIVEASFAQIENFKTKAEKEKENTNQAR